LSARHPWGLDLEDGRDSAPSLVIERHDLETAKPGGGGPWLSEVVEAHPIPEAS